VARKNKERLKEVVGRRRKQRAEGKEKKPVQKK